MNWQKLCWVILGASAVAAAASCGGTAIIDGDSSGGSGGSGGFGGGSAQGGNNNTTTTSFSSANGGSGNTGASAECSSMGDPTPGDCAGACDVLFCCAEPRCDGLSAADEDTFRNGCENNCAMQPAIINIVNGSECETTIDTITMVSAQFANVCENGLPGP